MVWQHINAHHFGQPSPDKLQSHKYLAARFPGGFRRGLSIGCGTGEKELNLLKLGIVEDFDLFELSERRIASGRERAASLGLTKKVKWTLGDAFALSVREQYDLIYWHAALHHMLDVPQAVLWCKFALKPGGTLVFNEYTGPARFQWSEASMEIGREVRAAMPKAIKNKIREATGKFSEKISRPSVDRMKKVDPSEAADSNRIISSIKNSFVAVELKHLGGWLYQLALNDVHPFLLTKEEILWMRSILSCDAGLARAGFSHFTFGIAENR